MYKCLLLVMALVATPAFAQQLYSGKNSATETVPPNTFSLLAWNLKKGSEFGFDGDFNYYSGQYDFVATQEVYLNNFMSKLFNAWLDYEWHAVEAWSKNNFPTGVGTLSRVASTIQTPLLSAGEPLINTAKSSLITYYQLPNGQKLMLVNTHGMLMGSAEEYQQQLTDIVEIAKNHSGPMIWTGDFNTWKFDRWESFRSAQKKLSLQHIKFDHDPRFQVLDHILYRDLKLLDASIHTHIESSDHYPLEATFSLM